MVALLLLTLLDLLVVVLAEPLRFLDAGADGEEVEVAVPLVAREAALVAEAAPFKNLRLAPL